MGATKKFIEKNLAEINSKRGTLAIRDEGLEDAIKSMEDIHSGVERDILDITKYRHLVKEIRKVPTKKLLKFYIKKSYALLRLRRKRTTLRTEQATLMVVLGHLQLERIELDAEIAELEAEEAREIRERRIAQIHEMIGIVLGFCRKFVRFIL